MLKFIFQGRYKILLSMIVSFIFVSFATRVFLLLLNLNNIDLTLPLIIQIFGVGLLYDFIASSYYFIPLVIYLLLIPTKIFNTKINKIILLFTFVMIFFVMLFNSVSEYFFWEEFGKRFNFIAVDYLVYTHEVIRNIQESYPVNIILSVILVISLLIIKIFKDKFFIDNDTTIFTQRLKISSIFLILPIIFFNAFDKQSLTNISNNIYSNELAKNGIYSFFSAFRHNELDYNEFYKTLPIKQVFNTLKNLEGFDEKDTKEIRYNTQPNRKNIVLIMVESLSAKYMGVYGNNQKLTPFLDDLTKKSLFFDNLFATGTRTVRGMEAVNLSIPPTPGRSIVKRPKNDNLDSIGKILKAQGYQNKFIYSGYGYFDNMNNFFANNGYEIVDRLKFEDDEITFANVWGACDGDLYDKTLKEADKETKPFFYFLMTTSNHRPFTYPDNKIDIPSHTGRSGAVKYTDFAIKEFIQKAQKKSWFKNTIFIIVADHNGSSAGKSSLPLYRYKIPCIVYAPYIIKPQTISKLSSQIDIMPTIFSILNIGYKAKFYGNDILANDFKPRTFIGNYQKLGFVENNYLYYLTPDKKSHKYKIDNLSLNNVKYKKEDITQKEEGKIITYYQSASYLYKNKN